MIESKRLEPLATAFGDVAILGAPPVKSYKDRASVLVWIYLEVKKMFIGLGKPETDEHVLEYYTEQIFQICYYENLVDIYKILQAGQRGLYGSIYGAWTLLDFKEWHRKYLFEKAELRERYLHNERIEEKTDDQKAPGLSEVYKKLLDKSEPKEERVKRGFTAGEQYFKEAQERELREMARHDLIISEGRNDYEPTEEDINEWIDRKKKDIEDSLRL